MPYISAHGGGVLMLMNLSMVLSAFGESSSSARLPRIHKFPMNFNDSQQVAHLRSSHGGRKLNETGTFSSDQIRINSVCTKMDINIFQGPDGSYSGIPRYLVKITNNCASCAPWDIHLFCGSFASSTMVNPNDFERIDNNDCLVGKGKALAHSQTLTFTYSNLFMYPLGFKSASFCN